MSADRARKIISDHVRRYGGPFLSADELAEQALKELAEQGFALVSHDQYEDENARLSAENAELLEALRPFVAADVYDDPPDNQAISGGPCAPLITYGDLRAASRVIAKHKGTD